MRDRRLDRVQGGRRGAGVASHLSAPSPNPQPTAHLPAESISASAFPHLRADYSCPRAGRARSGGNDDSLDVTQHAHLDCIFRLVAEEMRRLDAAVATLQEVGHGRRAEMLAGVQVGPPWNHDLASAPCVGLLLTSWVRRARWSVFRWHRRLARCPPSTAAPSQRVSATTRTAPFWRAPHDFT